MDTIRVDICYRPLRIAWAIGAGDLDSFRTAVQCSHALWGGRFNPIVVVDNEEEAGQLIDLFRVDFILPIGDTEAVKKFPDRFRHLIKPFFNDGIFILERNGEARAQALDIYNALVHFRDKPQGKALRDEGIRVYKWSTDDPLANVFVVMFGQYPSPSEINIDYGQMIVQGANATEHAIDPAVAIPEDTLKYPTIAYLSRHTVKRHYSVQAEWDSPGFFIGDASNFDDLVCHWNLRAADIPLWFIDPNHIKRYANIIPAWYKGMQELVSTRHEWDRHVGVWSRSEDVEKTKEMFGDKEVATHTVSIHTWNGLNLKIPMMYYDEVSTMGVIGKDGDKPKVAFALNDKPFCGDVWFHTQHLVASISFLGGLYGDEQFTLSPPLIPELNEFYARTMHFMYNVLRIEPGRIGIVINAADTDSFLNAMPVSVLIEKVFDLAKLSARPSPGGLITRQLIAQLGGLRNADVFKIPGVRRLLKTYGPTATFTKDSALQLIGGRDPQNPESNFKDYQDLYIEPRPPGTKLQPNTVFSYLVGKGIFRVGLELCCPTCRMASWISLDALKSLVVCELCGHEYDASRQIVDSKWYFRRSGVLGAERNAQGAVPVALTLQRLASTFMGGLDNHLYSTSLELKSQKSGIGADCEVDFVWIKTLPYTGRTQVIVGECKDQGAIKIEDFQKDIDNLRRVVDAFPSNRFDSFVLFAKLSPFTPEEIQEAKTLNDKYHHRAILLTARELEPFFIYERTEVESKNRKYAISPEDLARATVEMYFNEQP